jgi:HSP20 family protein
MSEVKVTKERTGERPGELTKPTVPTGEHLLPALPIGKLFNLNPFALMREFTDEMDRVFHGFTALKTEMFAPAIDVKVAGGNLVVTADLPGIKKEEVKIEVTEKALVLEGERKTEEKEEKPGYSRIERGYGKFHREIPLPEGAKIDLAKAELVDGVLTITLPVPETKKPRPVPIEDGGKIKVKAA